MRKYRQTKQIPTHPPIFASPVPPNHDLTYRGLAYRDTGEKRPVEKYGPTGHVIIYSSALLVTFTPSDSFKTRQSTFIDSYLLYKLTRRTSNLPVFQ